MSGFSAANVAVLSYDFTAFPQDGNPEEKCTGRGRIPEPSKDQLKAFFETMQKSFGTEQPSEEDVAGALDDRMYQATADLCSNKPSVEELKQLPPRILGAFVSWLLGQFAPKA